jgi:hypothetical protein
MYLTFSHASSNNSFLFSGITISSFDIDKPEIVEYLYQKFLILSTNFAVTSEPSSSKHLANIFFNAHLFNVSFMKPSHSGTISLNNNLP